jgi:hypothetical protein
VRKTGRDSAVIARRSPAVPQKILAVERSAVECGLTPTITLHREELSIPAV